MFVCEPTVCSTFSGMPYDLVRTHVVDACDRLVIKSLKDILRSVPHMLPTPSSRLQLLLLLLLHSSASAFLGRWFTIIFRILFPTFLLPSTCFLQRAGGYVPCRLQRCSRFSFQTWRVTYLHALLWSTVPTGDLRKRRDAVSLSGMHSKGA